MLCSVNPYFCSILGVHAHQAAVRIGGRTIIVLLEFNGRGAAFSILEFLCFASQIKVTFKIKVKIKVTYKVTFLFIVLNLRILQET